MNSTMELKNVKLVLDENQICLLDTVLATFVSDHPEVRSSRSDVMELKKIIRNLMVEVL